jgi:hypothetical protein
LQEAEFVRVAIKGLRNASFVKRAKFFATPLEARGEQGESAKRWQVKKLERPGSKEVVEE